MSQYDHEFYVRRHEKTEKIASTVLSALRNILPSLDSMVDMGCGVGTWPKVAKDNWSTKVLGVDGVWVEKELRQLEGEEFREHNLEERFEYSEKFDLAISLEVAEHLTSDRAETFVSDLVALSDFVFFSAAIPYQGGIGHINEQWPIYWIKKFEKHDYIAIDYVRKLIWQDMSIPSWYRQNTLLFVRKDAVGKLKLDDVEVHHVPPELYLESMRLAVEPGIKLSLKNLRNAIVRRLGGGSAESK